MQIFAKTALSSLMAEKVQVPYLEFSSMHRFRWLPGKVSTKSLMRKIEVGNTTSEECLVSQILRKMSKKTRLNKERPMSFAMARIQDGLLPVAPGSEDQEVERKCLFTSSTDLSGVRSATAHSTTRTRLAIWEVFAALVGWQREWQLRGGLQHRECERFWEHGGHWSWCRVSCEISWSGCSRRNEVIQGEKSNGSRSCGNVALCQGSWLLKFWLLKVWNSMTEMTKTEMKASSEKSSIENTELWEKIVWESGFVLSQTKWSGEKFGLAGVGDKIRMRGSQV